MRKIHTKASTRVLQILSVIVLVAMMSACSSTANTPAATTAPAATSTANVTTVTTAPAATAAATEPVAQNSWEAGKDKPVTVSVFYDKVLPTANFDKYWGKDPVSKKIMEDTGVSIEFQFPPDNDHTKLNVLIASGTIPDVIMTSDSLAEVQKLAVYDKIWAINELQETAAPGFVERNIDDHVLLDFRIRWDSMNLYGLPSQHVPEKYFEESFITRNANGIYVIDKVYEALGSPKLTTVDDFLNLLRQVKTTYPEMIPAQSSRNSTRDKDGNVRLIYKLFPMFGLQERYKEIDGKYVKYWYTDEYVALLKFANTVYNESLIDKTEFTDEGSQLQAKEFSGMVFCDMNNDSNNIDWFNRELHKVKADWNFINIDPPAFDPSVGYYSDTFGGGTGEDYCFIIAKNANAGRCLQLFDYLAQEDVQIMLVNGFEGQSFDYNQDGLPVVRADIKALEDDARKTTYGVGAYWLFRNGVWGALDSLLVGSELQIASTEVTNKYYKDLSFFTTAAESYPSDSEEIKIFANVKEYYEVAVMDIITGNPADVQSKYQTMMAQIAALGQATLDAHIDEYYQSKASVIEKYSAGLK